MSKWRPLLIKFLLELFRFHGLGLDMDEEPYCVTCNRKFNCRSSDSLDDEATLFRCKQCGPFLECRACCVDRHRRSPIHTIEVHFFLREI